MRDLINLTKALFENEGEQAVEPLLILVHPGSACGSADFNLGRSVAKAERQGLITDLNNSNGGLLVVDGDISDELPRYPALKGAIDEALARAKSRGLIAQRVFACDMKTTNWPTKVKKMVQNMQLDPQTPIEVTGAWVDGETGCVVAVYQTLQSLGFKNLVISQNALRLE
jgi:hypothetical protein